MEPLISRYDRMDPIAFCMWVCAVMMNQIQHMPKCETEAFTDLHFIWEMMENMAMRHFVSHGICSSTSPETLRKRRYRAAKRGDVWH